LEISKTTALRRIEAKAEAMPRVTASAEELSQARRRSKCQ
jgi:hypothetical protein